jgi:ABC-type polysaccharide/polyol phosphate transport system ATPase subunit
MTRINFRDVTKSFPHSSGRMLLRSHLLKWFSGEHRERFFALRNVSFRLGDGESLALIGSNGAGKSTLLSLVAGLSRPDSGSIETRGRIAALLELGSGFHPDLSGAENLILNASLLGLSRRETYDAVESIVDFSGIADFIHEPLRTYSSGMVVRLAFSVAIHTTPDILIVDEVLGVGDISFQQKSAEALRHMRQSGKTLLFVSHSGPTVLQMCDRALWLDHGRLMADGDARQVVAEYEQSVSAPAPQSVG